ncbi:alpha/beta hydrolase [Maribacter sp. 1_MG-2023]|uniref:alpha/beta hydrolase n=1 Tax=Maribacter sp. 1_MG-2023 TaxID=3062677 RepID=UPI0026E2D4AF|nr:alpha/beta hydrolase [Maribacter sp. 1_MG-2023]MDO6472095.1 alpha/beta hydrolase [Maribacter sp. 1_MG-2023]
MQLKTSLFLFLLLTANTSFSQNKIAENKFISIGGIEQWITINGNDTSNPVVLLIHGGPGSTMSHYKDDVYAEWMKEFTIVHWDQRGAGRTFGRNCPKEINDEFYANNLLSVADMTNDGIAVTEYLLKRLDKRKVILMGTSWGSILATQMAQKNPDLFHAYVGHAQFVNFSKNIKNAYLEAYKLAEENEDKQVLLKLKDLGPPPYQIAKNYGQLLRVVKQFEKEHSKPAPSNWWKIASEYENNKDSRDRYNGDDYSFLNLVGDQRIRVKSMVSDINLNNTAVVFRLPVFMIQGKHDIICSTELNKPYFEKIRAPRKEYYTVSNAAHGFNEAIIDKQYEIVKALSVQN